MNNKYKRFNKNSFLINFENMGIIIYGNNNVFYFIFITDFENLTKSGLNDYNI